MQRSDDETAHGLDRIIIFTDGACSGNPGKGGWGAVIARPDGTIEELGAGFQQTTNNQMEMMATLRSLQAVAADPAPVTLYTDSVYVIRGITEWIHGWRRRGWKTAEGGEVANQELWQALDAEVRHRGAKTIAWKFVKGHSGVPGNERVDEIAVAFTHGRRPRLYRGPLLGYDVPIHDLPPDRPLPEIKNKAAAKAKAFSYLSYVDGKVESHSSWTECEQRVKGRSGAKFKKATSADDEQQILRAWGLRPDSLK